jgi:hypothetical protein
LKHHKDSVKKFVITTDDCAHLFRKIPYESVDLALQEKWRLIGQCLSKVCSKRCTWSDPEVRASAANVCEYTTPAEEAIVYWLFVSEGEDWIREFEGIQGKSTKEVDDADTTSTTQRKRCGKHKTLCYLKHWWQLRGIVKTRRLNRHISGKWDEAWKMFACEELEIKKNKRGNRKRSIKDVLPTFEDVLGVGESEGDYKSGLDIEEDLDLFCTQASGV